MNGPLKGYIGSGSPTKLIKDCDDRIETQSTPATIIPGSEGHALLSGHYQVGRDRKLLGSTRLSDA